MSLPARLTFFPVCIMAHLVFEPWLSLVHQRDYLRFLALFNGHSSGFRTRWMINDQSSSSMAVHHP